MSFSQIFSGVSIKGTGNVFTIIDTNKDSQGLVFSINTTTRILSTASDMKLMAGNLISINDMVVGGKLTVSDIITNPGLTITENSSNPGDVVAGSGTIWVRDDTPNRLIYTDDNGTDFIINGAGGGDVNGPAAATTNAISRYLDVSGKNITNSNITLDNDGNFYKDGNTFIYDADNNFASGSNSLASVTAGGSNTSVGIESLLSATTGSFNTAVGNGACKNLTTGSSNISVGFLAGTSISTGQSNIAIGTMAPPASLKNAMVLTGTNNIGMGSSDVLRSLTSGNDNICVGRGNMVNSTTASNNIGIGPNSCAAITTATGNTGIGTLSLNDVTTGDNNIALGTNAGQTITTASDTIAIGRNALSTGVLTGSNNIAIGLDASTDVTTGINNICVGQLAGQGITSGSGNISVGFAGFFNGPCTGNSNIGIGSGTLEDITTGDLNVSIGEGAGGKVTVGQNNIAIGSSAGNLITTASGTISIGSQGANITGRIEIGNDDTASSCFIHGIEGTVIGGGGIPVLIDTNGQLGTVASARKYKYDIYNVNEKNIEQFLKLRPVEFKYNGHKKVHYGLIADEVYKVLPNLAHIKNGEIESIYYDGLHAFYVKAIQMLWEKNKELENKLLSI